MTTSTPNTVTQLLDIQEKLDQGSWEDLMMDEVTNHDPLETKHLMTRMIQCLRSFHVSGVRHYQEEGDINSMMNWVVDVERLDQIQHLLDQIELG